MDLKLNKCIRELSKIRFDYDNIKLSEKNRRNMTKLEIKTLIAERALALDGKIKEDNLCST